MEEKGEPRVYTQNCPTFGHRKSKAFKVSQKTTTKWVQGCDDQFCEKVQWTQTVKRPKSEITFKLTMQILPSNTPTKTYSVSFYNQTDKNK